MGRWGVLLASLAVLLQPLAVAAGTSDGMPVTPAAGECRVRPKSLIAIRRLLEPGVPGTPLPDLPAALATEADLPRSRKADAETLAALTAAARQITACRNAGDARRFLALTTDGYLRRSVADLSADELTAFLTALAAPPAPRPESEWTTLVAVRDARIMGQDRVGAVVETDDPTDPDGDHPAFAIFVQERDRWLLDATIEIIGS